MSLADFIAIHSFGSLDVSVKGTKYLNNSIYYLLGNYEGFFLLYRLYNSGHATGTEIVH